MCQAVWRSPNLPLIPTPDDGLGTMPHGAGSRFKHDLLCYLYTYGNKLVNLTRTLRSYDFSAVRACLIASTPGTRAISRDVNNKATLWGWPALRQALSTVPSTAQGRIVVQISSVASLGITDKWLSQTLLNSLRSRAPDAEETRCLGKNPRHQPGLAIVFPTAEEIRLTIDGYGCGGSIHMKTQSAAQEKQLAYLRQYLCHWASDPDSDTATKADAHIPGASRSPESSCGMVREAGRKRTGPHIKTYLKFADEAMTELDWAMVTSANLSKQAWGAEEKDGKVRICSYEIGVLLWPGLWDGGQQKAVMQPTFKQDTPQLGSGPPHQRIRVGLRMPYDLPLVHYANSEEPWCNSIQHLTPDWMGRVWPGGDT